MNQVPGIRDVGNILLSQATLDLQSPSGRSPDSWRLAVNIIGDREGQPRRLGGWRKLSGIHAGDRKRIAVIGDFGDESANALNVANRVRLMEPDAIVTAGDNVYWTSGGNSTSISNALGPYREYINPWLLPYPLPAGRKQRSEMSFFPSLGNHDIAPPSGYALQEVSFFETIWGDKGYADAEGDLHYTFTVGPVRFVMLNSNAPGDPDFDPWFTRAIDWISSVIATSASKYHVLVAHHPPYTNDTAHAPGTAWMRQPWEAFGFDLVISGHGHNYERFRVRGVPYVVVGNSGTTLRGFTSPLQASGSVIRVQEYGTLIIDADDDSLVCQMVNVAGVVKDAFCVGFRNQDLHDQLLPGSYPETPYECLLKISAITPSTSVTRVVGGSASFAVETSGGVGGVTYKWYKIAVGGSVELSDGAIAGATCIGSSSRTLMLESLTTDASGTYQCVAVDGLGCQVASQSAYLFVSELDSGGDPYSAPSKLYAFVGLPSTVELRHGSSHTFTASAVGGTPAYTYKWHKIVGGELHSISDGAGVSGSATSSMTFNPVASDMDGQYICIVTDSGVGANQQTASTGVVTVNYIPALAPVDCIGDALSNPASESFPSTATTLCARSNIFTPGEANYNGAKSNLSATIAAASGLTADEKTALQNIVNSSSAVGVPYNTYVSHTATVSAVTYTASLFIEAWYDSSMFLVLRIEYSRP